ncbi:hypothetical protein Tsubulata_005959 [Turnera subulata]|uniref:DUF4283 domain-containing protein n=1 Tax=Turnera subulata TaxID=218843 RepID=A0A9Q0FL95_9ROSI|nr:hypothetical protein Tsubulata_005959 [Turnera subulata]
MNDCLENRNSWMGEYFQLVKEWGMKDYASHCTCWINIDGTPPQAWCGEFFKSITLHFGKFIQLFNNTETSNSLEVARVQVLTIYKEPIVRVFKALVGGRPFEISVVESPTGMS